MKQSLELLANDKKAEISRGGGGGGGGGEGVGVGGGGGVSETKENLKSRDYNLCNLRHSGGKFEEMYEVRGLDEYQFCTFNLHSQIHHLNFHSKRYACRFFSRKYIFPRFSIFISARILFSATNSRFCTQQQSLKRYSGPKQVLLLIYDVRGQVLFLRALA